MRILLLGGHGFVGQNIAALLGPNHELVIASRQDGLDLTDLAATRDRLAAVQPEVIVNCAANVGSLNYVSVKAAEVVDQNLRMLLNVYRAVAEVCAHAVVVNPVANCAFPGDLDVYREDLFWLGEVHRSVLSYGSTRRMMLVLSECYAMQHGVRSVNLLTPNMYGPHDSTDPNKAHALNALVSRVVQAQAEGRPEITVWGTGTPVREWLYAGDFARVLASALPILRDQALDRPVNVARNAGWSVREILDRIVAEVGYDGRVVWDRDRPDGAPRKVMDDERFVSVFGDFAFTPLSDGIRATIAHYRSVLPY